MDPLLSNLPASAARCIAKLLRLGVLASLLGWCCMVPAHAQEAKEQTKLMLSIEAAPGVNPDTSLRPSPIKVRIYELKDASAFSEADYFSLDTSDKIALAADMLAKDEFILRPGESRSIERKSNAQTTAIGVLAGYRDLPNATWRTTYKLKEAPAASWMRMLLPANRAELLIQLQPQGIAVIEKP
ncbi:type VI secretion system lipoprotein TssJ [Rhodoferax lacus]|uniref:Type VI secretion system lipoprotein TssJ n=1 Tax=Rhodoferax lacus TaxID=2184758 RepID=A0A3E1RA71_9BURK|nr:type VI secretion system lipoprotein TssJ [Rhodoferax lacus]RFO96237.1 type VI secretion system lipoprotein TssJ [Rhodoferax lacus]